MPDLNVTIPLPILGVGEKFKVRQRLLPSGAFSAYVDRTNAQFTLTGLSVGTYEFEVIVVTASAIECDPAYFYKEILPEFTCWDFTASMIESPANSGLYYIELGLSGGTQPPCGWEIEYVQGGTTKSVIYPTLSGSSIRIPVNNLSTQVTVFALLCNGNEKQCYTVTVSVLPDPPDPCVGVVIEDTLLVEPPEIGLPYSLYIQFTDSTPHTNNAHIIWQQLGTPVTTGNPLDFGFFIFPNYLWGGIAPNLNIWLNQLYPVPTIGVITYQVRFLDQCGTWHTFNVTV